MSNEDKKSIKKKWGKTGDKPVLFEPKEVNLYSDKETFESFIYHGKKIDYDSIDRLEYNPADHSIDVIMKNGSIWDLGVKLRWLIRPYFTKAPEVTIMQTKDGEILDGRMYPLTHKKLN